MNSTRLIKKTVLCAVILGIVYLLACTYLWARQGYFIFTPRRDIKKTPAVHQLRYEDVFMIVENKDGHKERIHGWWIPADSPESRVLLYLHGSAINIGANVDSARRFHEMGFSVLLVSYRGFGNSDGVFPTEKQVYADAEAAWNYLVTQKSIAPGSIFIYGHSIGGAIAIDLAVSHPDAAGLIVEATFTSIIDMAHLQYRYRLLPMHLIVEQKFDSLSKVDDLNVPALFIHGTHDRRVPPEMSRRLYENTSSPKHIKFIKGGGHNNNGTIGGEDYIRTIREFVGSVNQKS
ncbi:MAG: alpha/beta fold hydrolase [Deltaproteobacteria bacterium]|jgi:pimeloyl-ACP methyl ester carboxylesterase|nr:alpha/beta fold hydrolase [Deltaproteobacteria bacterium]